MVPVYPEKIASLIRTSRFARSLETANAVGTEAKFDCGCFVRVEMSISEVGQIEDAGYRTNGCGFMAAAAEFLAESVGGRLLTELSGVPDPCLQLPPARQDCLQAVTNAFRFAFASYRAKRIEEFPGEKPLICTCFGIAEETVEEFVAAKRPRSVDDVSNTVRAGSGCGSCRMLIQEIIDAND